MAAHASAEHLVALKLPQDVQQKMGRLVGHYEQCRKGAGTPIDVPLEDRNRYLQQKSLLIGCGGGYQQECGQPYSPVSEWMKTADVLEDEGQQYGNMEEASSIARTPQKCLEIWCGDHRQKRLEAYNKQRKPRTSVANSFGGPWRYVVPPSMSSHKVWPTLSCGTWKAQWGPHDVLAQWVRGSNSQYTQAVQKIWRM